MANKTIYSKNDVAIVNALKGAEDGLTLAEINAKTGLNLKPGNITGTSRKGLIEVIGERDSFRPSKRKVSLYTFVTAEPLKNDEGKVYNYTDNEKLVLNAAATFEGPFSLADLAVVMNKERMSSGSINGLVKKHNILKTEVMREVPTTVKKPVNVYAFVKDIPADAEVRGQGLPLP